MHDNVKISYPESKSINVGKSKSPNRCSKAEVKRLLEDVRCQKDVDILGFY